MSTIFISHSSKDSSLAFELIRRLEMQGHRSIFLDFNPEEGIPAGRNWEKEPYWQLLSCQALIVMCSEHSISSCWCFAEITHEKSPGKRVFTITVGPCVIDPVLTSQQIIDLARNSKLSKPDDTYNQIRCNLGSEYCS